MGTNAINRACPTVGMGSKNISEHIDVNSSVMSAAKGRTTPKKTNAPSAQR